MKSLVSITILGLVLGNAIWAVAQPQDQMASQGIIRGIQMAQAASEATSTYSNLCASCHGASGQGDGPAALALNPKPKDFADCKVMAKTPDDTLFKAIKGGGQSVGLSSMMPSWGGSLTDKQIHSLVEYVRSFCKK